MLDKLKKFIDENKLIEKNDRLLIAISGGPDSVGMLTMLNDAKLIHPKKTIAVYIDHGLRKKEEIKREIQFVKDFTAKLGIKFVRRKINTKDHAKQKKLSIEQAGRELRYKKLVDVAKKYKLNKILTAHTFDDHIETVFFNLLRGSGIKGLKGILPSTRIEKNIYLVRPMLWSRKKDIIEYLNLKQQSYVTDKTNYSTDYTRNYIRHQIFPKLKRVSLKFRENLNDFSILMRKLNEYLSKISGRIIDELILKKEGNFLLDIKKFLKYNTLEREIVILEILEKLKVLEKRQKIIKINKMCETNKPRKLQLSKKWEVVRENNSLIFHKIKKNEMKDFLYEIKPNQKNKIKELNIEISSEISKTLPSKFAQTNNVAYIDWEKIKDKSLLIRNWKEGDYFYPLGMRGRKKLHDFFIDLKIPQHERKRIPFLCADDKIIWVIGYRQDETTKITPRTTEVIKFEFKKLHR